MIFAMQIKAGITSKSMSFCCSFHFWKSNWESLTEKLGAVPQEMKQQGITAGIFKVVPALSRKCTHQDSYLKQLRSIGNQPVREMAPFSKETIATSKELVNAVLEAVGCHDGPCWWMLSMMEDDVFLKHRWAGSLILIGRLEKHKHMRKKEKNQCPKWCTAVGILDQLTRPVGTCGQDCTTRCCGSGHQLEQTHKPKHARSV